MTYPGRAICAMTALATGSGASVAMLNLAQCRHAQGHHDEAIQQLISLLHTVSVPKERVLVLETLWQLTQEHKYLEDALILYRTLQEQLPATVYAKCIETLEQALAPTRQE
jgi:hypothetical protein